MGILRVLKIIAHCILVPREYYKIDGQVYVREWFKKPEELMEHLEREHPDEYQMIKGCN